MYVMIGLSVATGLPWEYFQRQDDRVNATYLDLLAQARTGKKARTGPGKWQTTTVEGGKRVRQMSG